MQIKKWIFPAITALALIVTGCGGSAEADIAGHLITGNISNAEGAQVILSVVDGKEEKSLDTTVVKDGHFEIATETKELREYILFIGEEQMPILLFLDEEDKDVTIDGSLPGIGENYTVSGSEESQYIKDYLVFLKGFYQQEQLIFMELQQLRQTNSTDTATIKGLFNELDSISAIQRDYAVAHIESHPGSPTGWLLLRELFPPSGLVNFNEDDLKYFQMVADGIREKYPYSEYPDLIELDLSGIKAQLEQMKNPTPLTSNGTTAPFEYAPEITLPNPDGEDMSLSDLRGKIVLIDFWASWCGPCRRENPNVVRVYEEYKDKGFTVFSVSLDKNKEDWIKAIGADNLLWPNHVSDLQGWQSAAAINYGVNAIPATFLIDGEGKVIGTNLRGPQLEQKLQEVLG